MDYQSEKTVESKTAPGVKLTIARMSLGRRIELTRRIWETARKVECLSSGSDPREKLEAALLAREIDREYLSWGLMRVEGLMLDGQPATPETLIAVGAEELIREALAAVKAECGLSEEERKN
ncbi:MAG: hypothetical protein ACLQGV_04235 [Bryobacteraceae bacterium]